MARRTFFSFHYSPDCWRAWNVRNSWVVSDRRESVGFFDSSVVEKARKEGEENLKTFLRNGLKNTSVTCVLAGQATWQRRWVRYEIAQSVLKGNGLLTVDIHGVRNQQGIVSTKGKDPLEAMGLYRSNGSIYFAEHDGSKWVAYRDYSKPVPSDVLWFGAPETNSVVPLSESYFRRDFVGQDGRKNLAEWIELAALVAGR